VVRSFTPTFFNELLVSGSRERWWKGTGDPTVKYTDELGLPNPFNVAGWPGLYDGGLNDEYYFETDNTQAGPQFYVIVDNNSTKIKGRHELQFGFHFRYDQMNLLPDQQQNQGNHSWATGGTSLYDPSTARNAPQGTPLAGDNLANMYLGIMNYSNQFVRGYFYARAKEYALYFQDNYKVSPRLTLNMGLRWEYWPALSEKNNMLTSFDPSQRAVVLGNEIPELYRMGATLPPIVNRLESLGAKFITWDQAGLPRSMTTSPKTDFGPRLGLAYRATDGDRRSSSAAATASLISTSRCALGWRVCDRTRRRQRASGPVLPMPHSLQTALAITACEACPRSSPGRTAATRFLSIRRVD